MLGLTITNDLNSYTASVARNTGVEALVLPSLDAALQGTSNELDQSVSNGSDLQGYAQKLLEHEKMMAGFSELSFSSRGFVQSSSAELSNAA